MEHPLWKLADTSLPARVDIRERVLSVNTARVKVVKMGRVYFDSFRPWHQSVPKWDGVVLTQNHDERGAALTCGLRTAHSTNAAPSCMPNYAIRGSNQVLAA